MDEKSRATIEQMLKEEEFYFQRKLPSTSQNTQETTDAKDNEGMVIVWRVYSCLTFAFMKHPKRLNRKKTHTRRILAKDNQMSMKHFYSSER